MKPKTLKEALKIIRESCKDKYAQSYIEVLEEVVEDDGMEGLEVQIRYLLENCKSWKGKEAQETKSFIRLWLNKKSKTIYNK